MERDQIPGLPPQLASLTTGPGLLSVTWVSLILSFYTQALTSSSPVQLLLFFSFLDFIFSILFWPHYSACGILVPQTEITPIPPTLGAGSLHQLTYREFSQLFL